MTIKIAQNSPDQLLKAQASSNGGKFEPCFLYLAQIDQDSLILSSDKLWETLADLRLQIELNGRFLHLSASVDSRERALGKLWFYRLSLKDLDSEQTSEIRKELHSFIAPEGRQYYRHFCPSPFEISVRLEHSTQPVNDISCGGFRFTAAENYELNSETQVKLFLDGFAVVATVQIDRKEEKVNGFVEYGCSFQDISSQDSGQLKDYIYSRAASGAA